MLPPWGGLESNSKQARYNLVEWMMTILSITGGMEAIPKALVEVLLGLSPNSPAVAGQGHSRNI
jgi:hypothetical protein